MASLQSASPPSLAIPVQTNTSQSGPRKRPRKTDRKSPATNEQKLRITIETLEANRCNVSDFLRTISQHRTEAEYRTYWRQFKIFAYQEMIAEDRDEDSATIDSEDYDRILTAGGFKRVQHILRKELTSLSNGPWCGEIHPPPGPDRNGTLNRLRQMQVIVQNRAPRLLQFLNMIARPSRTSQPMPLGRRQVFWVLQLLYCMQHKECSGFAKIVSVDLMNSGVKKRAINMLSALGVCPSYNTTLEVVRLLACAPSIVQASQSTTQEVVQQPDSVQSIAEPTLQPTVLPDN